MATTTTDDTAFAEDHPFMDIFGSPGRTKIVAAFVSEKGRSITVTYAAKLAGVSRSTVYEHLDDLVEIGILKEDKRGKTTYYTLDEDSDIGHELYRLEGITLRARQEQ